ncbi:unnamed protein product [Peniophora sp. CBMAI 1063]|nr:unnamed protein product [Peniophora sp. CBMAI 1063]
MPALWAKIVCVFPQSIETILLRAKGAPLSLYIDQWTSANAVWDIINRYDLLRGARVLDCSQDSQEHRPLRDWSAYLVNRQLPQLQHLTLHIVSFTDVAHLQYQPPIANSLRSLAINVPFPIIAPTLESLHTIGTIWHQPMLLEYLEQYPGLRTLNIDAVSGDHRGFARVISEETLLIAERMKRECKDVSLVRLPDLRTLKFGYAGENAFRLVRNIEAPVCDRSVVANVWSQPDLLSLLARLRALCHVDLNAFTLFARGNADRTIDMAFTDEHPYVGRPDELDDRAFTRGVLIGYSTGYEPYVNRVPSVLDALPSPLLIRTLVLDHSCDHLCRDLECGGIMWDVSPATFARALKSFRSVTTLHLVGQEGGIKVPAILGQKLEDLQELVLPSLRELFITLRRPACHVWWENLRTVLSARKEAGCPISRMIVRGAGACHTYRTNRFEKEQAKAYAQLTASSTSKSDALSKWLKYCEVTLVQERMLVTELVDERALSACDCAAGALHRGKRPWEFVEPETKSMRRPRTISLLDSSDLCMPLPSETQRDGLPRRVPPDALTQPADLHRLPSFLRKEGHHLES